MKVDLKLGLCIFIGIEGTNIEEIKDEIVYNEGLSDYGRSLLTVIEGNNNSENEILRVES